jgi:mannitol 2-dehydrogenase
VSIKQGQKMNIQLSASALNDLPIAVLRPTYDRSKLQPGILHIGLGNFHRAHQAVYLNDLLNAGGDPAWGILGAGVREADNITRNALLGQDCLFSVVEVEFDTFKASVIGVMTDFVPVQPDGNAALISEMTNPATKIVSLTVTEGGYFLNGEGELDLADRTLQHDIKNPKNPKTAFGAMIAALSARRAECTKPFTIMSCDNLPGNGDIAREVVLGIAGEVDRDLAMWIEDSVTFPNGMVDRITPATGDRERQFLSDKFGIDDKLPVLCEPFRQWVLEDNFVNGRPALEDVGVTFTNEIENFEKMKLRILNGGHAIMAYAAGLMGIKFAHEAAAHPLIRAYLREVIERDVLPNVSAVPGFTPQEYLETILTRFSNPAVADTISRLCCDGTNRQPKFIVGSIKDCLKAGKSPDGLALSSALWSRYCLGRDDNGGVLEPNDPAWDRLQEVAQKAQSDPAIWLGQEHVYGSVGRDLTFMAAFEKYYRLVQEKGTSGAIQTYLAAVR